MALAGKRLSDLGELRRREMVAEWLVTTETAGVGDEDKQPLLPSHLYRPLQVTRGVWA